MKDHRFTELLNLRLDHELTPAEAAELEAEIQRDPARRRQYREYCRMQRACAQLFEREHARAPASFALERALRDAERKVAAPAGRPVFGHPLTTAFTGFAAMAACVALVVLRSPPVAQVQAPVTGTLVAASQPSPAAPVTPATYAVVPAVLTDYKTVSLGSPSATNLADADSGRAVADWVQGVVLPALEPVNMGGLSGGAADTLQPSLASESSPSSLQVNTEFVGFQFQR